MNHTYTKWGGVTIGYRYSMSLNSGWPSAHLTATETGIKLRVFWKQYHFEKASISAIVQFNGLLGFLARGIRILHTKDNYPRFIVFWPFNRKKLVSELRRLGYPIDDRIDKRWN